MPMLHSRCEVSYFLALLVAGEKGVYRDFFFSLRRGCFL